MPTPRGDEFDYARGEARRAAEALAYDIKGGFFHYEESEIDKMRSRLLRVRDTFEKMEAAFRAFIATPRCPVCEEEYETKQEEDACCPGR
jgi:hypothetical protein